MAKVVTTLALLCAIAITSCRGQYAPLATLYSNTGCNGAFVKLPIDPIPDLAQLGFDNRAYSIRLTGTWLFYESTAFNRRGTETMEYIFQSQNKCVDFAALGGYISSVKIAGSRTDYRSSSISFYEHTYFQGIQEYVVNDTPNLDLVGYQSSFIVTGASDWTIYDKPYYAGNAICLKIKDSPYYLPAFVPDTEKLVPKIPHGSIASVRKGCFTANVVSIDVSSSSGTNSNLVKL